MEEFVLFILFFIIALFYSMAGFGGGSSYLAIMTVLNINYLLIRPIALICNIVVVLGGVIIFYRAGFFKWKKITPLIITSIPLAYLGGRFSLTENYFFILLGITLLLAAVFMLLPTTKKNKTINQEISSSKNNYLINSLLGGAIGFLSGLVGIGGGIFLAPILHLINWDTTKVISATASFFILVNSIAGLAGQFTNTTFTMNWQLCFLLITAVFLGGQIGNRVSIQKLSPRAIKSVTAILILIVALRILIKYGKIIFTTGI